MTKEPDSRRIEVVLDGTTLQKLAAISNETGATRTFLVKKAIRLYLQQRHALDAPKSPPWPPR